VIRKKYTAVETWIWDNLQPEESNSAAQTYDAMIWQAEGKLPVINQPLNLRDPAHFADEARIREYLVQIKGAEEVLDIGPGDGWPALRIAPHVRMVTGIDASLRRVEVSRSNAERLKIDNVKFAKMSAVELDFADKSFDAVVAASSIEQTPNPIQALQEAFRVLKPGGGFSVDFESFDVTRQEPLSEAVSLLEHPDGVLGWHYRMKHRDPPWERDYLVKLKPVPETAEAFKKARELIAQAGDNPTTVREIGVEFLEANKTGVQASSYYELEHFTTQTMIESLEDVGFTDVRTVYSAARLARLIFPALSTSQMSDEQLTELAQALAEIAASLPAPLDQGQPVVATKPKLSS
jgi:ubiquinone/menaquinone biosynthesis C-methylase UbiE